jgi:hypothetical protein
LIEPVGASTIGGLAEADAMGADPILERFDRLNVWSRKGQRAPHKPLLVLYALGRWARGETADIPFREAAPALTDLLKEFGPPGSPSTPSTRSGVCRTTASGG